MELTYLGEVNNYKLYRNSDGFIEGYISKVKDDVKSDLQRIVSQETTPAKFIEFVKGFKVKSKNEDNTGLQTIF